MPWGIREQNRNAVKPEEKPRGTVRGFSGSIGGTSDGRDHTVTVRLGMQPRLENNPEWLRLRSALPFRYCLGMTERRFPPPWTVEKIPGGLKVCDANGQSPAYVYSRENPNDAHLAKVLTEDEARRIASNIAKLPTLLAKGIEALSCVVIDTERCGGSTVSSLICGEV